MTRHISNAQLAREMLEKAVSEWQEASKGQEELDFFLSDVDGKINIGLEFKTAYGLTTILFNPQATVEELVERCQRRLQRLGLWKNEQLRERLLRTQINGSIRIMLTVIRTHFEDSLWELPLVVSTLYDWSITQPDSRRRLFDDLLDSVSARKRERFEIRGRGRRQVIVDELVFRAVKELGGSPSQRAVAQILKVSEKALREWRKSRGFSTWDSLLKWVEIGRK